jgi:hypothetical protein
MTAIRDTQRIDHGWAAILASSTVLGSLALACIFPFAALAALLAATLPLRKAALWMGAAWLGNQLVGYLLLGYPQTANSFAHGAAIGVTALATLGAAHLVLTSIGRVSLPSLVLALVAAFVTYEAMLYGFALMLGGAGNFTADIVLMIARNDALWFAGLGALWLALNFGRQRMFAPTAAS